MSILRIYGHALAQVPQALRKAPWALLVPFLYAGVTIVAAMLCAPLGLVGGFIMGFVDCAIFAAGLFLVSELMDGHRIPFVEVFTGVRRFFWPVMNVLFVAWIAGMLIDFGTANMPDRTALVTAIDGVALVLLNAVPETISRKQVFGGMEILSAALAFMQEHWIEWLIPNAAIVALFWFGVPYVARFAVSPLWMVLSTPLLWGVLALPAFLFRGYLFDALDGRRRPFRWAR